MCAKNHFSADREREKTRCAISLLEDRLGPEGTHPPCHAENWLLRVLSPPYDVGRQHGR